MADVVDLHPVTDSHTRTIITQAIGLLALTRDLSTIEPAARLHLLTSLIQQAETMRTLTILDAADAGYNPTQIQILLDLG